MQPNLSLVTLGTNDLPRAIAFFEEALGWKPHPSSQDEVAFYQLNGIAFAFWGKDRLADDAKVAADGSGFEGFALAINMPSEAEVDEVIANAEKAGAKVLKHAEKVFWGGYSGYFADLDGHVWEVAYNPFWELNDGIVTLPS
jgi:uncharacterized glyoxalase superfamily protein PhnB